MTLEVVYMLAAKQMQRILTSGNMNNIQSIGLQKPLQKA
jgi:hypothetical protein